MQILFTGPWESVKETFFGCLVTICGWIYSLVGWLYEIFMSLAGARLLTTEIYNDIANTIYIIIGVAMLFVVSYAFLQGIIDPDKMGGKSGQSGGAVLRKVLIAVIGLGVAPVLFNILYQTQTLIMENDIIGKVIFRSGDPENDVPAQSVDIPIDNEGNTSAVTVDSYNPNDYLTQVGGTSMATNVWSAFFYPRNTEVSAEDVHGAWSKNWFLSFSSSSWSGFAAACAIGAGIIGGIIAFSTAGVGTGLLVAGISLCAGAAVTSVGAIADNFTADDLTLAAAYNLTASGVENFGVYNAFIPNIIADSDDEIDKGEGTVEFNFIACIVSGGVMAWCFVSFCIDMAVRAAKLAYYQIIAPIPLILQVLPKFKDTFNNYIKNVMSTFFEVFIRIFVVYIIVYIISHLSSLFQGSNLFEDLGFVQTGFAYVFLVLGLVIFAKQAPKLISDTLGIKGGSLSLNIGKKLADGGAFAVGATLGATATAGVRNFRNTWTDAGGISGSTWSQRVASGVRSGARAARSSVGGAGSAAFRSVKGQFIGPGHKPAMTWGDTKAQAGRSAMGATDARNKRKDFYEEQEALGRTGVNAFVRGHAHNAAENISAWSVGTLTTEAYDNQVKLMGQSESVKGDTRDNTAKDTHVQAAKTLYDDLLKREVNTDPTYRAQIQAAAASVRRSAYATQAEYDSAVQAARDAAYANAAADLAEKQNNAKKAYEAAQDEAALRLMADPTKGVNEKAYQTLQKYFTDNVNNLYKNQNMKIKVPDLNDPTITRDMMLGDFIKEYFGADALEKGVFDMNRMLDHSRFVVNKGIDAAGNAITESYKMNAQGNFESLTHPGTIINAADFHRDIRANGWTYESKTAINVLSDVGKTKANEIKTSDGYREAYARKRAQQERRDK